MPSVWICVSVCFLFAWMSHISRGEECGTITYQEPAILGRYVRIFLNPIKPNDVMTNLTWRHLNAERQWDDISNNTSTMMFSRNGVFVLDYKTYQGTPSIRISANLGLCRIRQKVISLTELDLKYCGVLDVKPKAYRPGEKVVITYYPHATIRDNPSSYKVTWYVRSQSCTQGCLVENTLEQGNGSFHDDPIYSLEIESVSKEANGEYYVRCKNGSETRGIDITTPERPGPPTLLNTTDIDGCDGCIVGMIGSQLSIKCQTIGGTSPEVHVVIGDERKNTTYYKGYYSTMVQLTEAHHEQLVRCEVINLALKDPWIVSAKLYVAKKPTGLKIKMGELKEGESPNVICSIEGGRPTVGLRLRWGNDNGSSLSLSPEQVIGNTISISLLEVKRSFNGRKLKCCYQRSNVFPQYCTSETIIYKYPPEHVLVEQETKFTSIQDKYQIEYACHAVNYSAQCNTSWSLNNIDVTPTTVSNNLTLVGDTVNKTRSHVIRMNVKRSDNGSQLTCSSRCGGFTAIKRGRYSIWVPREPEISFNTSSSTLNVTEGDRFVLKCIVKSQPEPDIKWQNEAGETLSSVGCGKDVKCMILERVTQNMTGTYTCLAKNRLSKYVTKEIQLSITEINFDRSKIAGKTEDGKSSFPVIPVIVALVCVLVIVVVVVVAIVMKKKKSPTKSSKENQDRNTISPQPAGHGQEENAMYSSPIPKSQRLQGAAAVAENKPAVEDECTYSLPVPKDQRPGAGEKDKQVPEGPKELIYADLDLPMASSGQNEAGPTLTVRSEGETEYVDIDFSKKAAQLPVPCDIEDNTYANQ